MTSDILLPTSTGGLISYTPTRANPYQMPSQPFTSRIAYSAAHVVANPLADVDPSKKPVIDWEGTLAYRRYLWSLGLAVAEAMDTSQRGMGLDWETSKELIRLSLNEAKAVGGDIACGAGTDHLSLPFNLTIDEITKAYLEQCDFVEGHGGRIILMASRALAACAKGPEDYNKVYDQILTQVEKPVILHWLGDMFDPALSGYWGYTDPESAMQSCLGIIHRNIGKVYGIKISLLDSALEIKLRNSLPKGVRMFTGDDFNYQSLIAGDKDGYSDALLGIFDAIAPAASAALHALDKGDLRRYDQFMAPTLPLSRHIFKAPTYYYKTGIVFMAYLNGHQSHFRMIAGHEVFRSIPHLSELFVLADQANLLQDPDLALHRMKLILHLAGISDKGSAI
ncbi:MAG: dihydrodipicolinate synthase family protein [Paenibacillaceae bacterium]